MQKGRDHVILLRASCGEYVSISSKRVAQVTTAILLKLDPCRRVRLVEYILRASQHFAYSQFRVWQPRDHIIVVQFGVLG